MSESGVSSCAVLAAMAGLFAKSLFYRGERDDTLRARFAGSAGVPARTEREARTIFAKQMRVLSLSMRTNGPSKNDRHEEHNNRCDGRGYSSHVRTFLDSGPQTAIRR